MGQNFFNSFYVRDLTWCFREPGVPRVGWRADLFNGSKERFLRNSGGSECLNAYSECSSQYLEPLKLREETKQKPNGFQKKSHYCVGIEA